MGRKKSRNASTSGSSSHNRSQTDLRRSNFVHKFSRTNFVRKVSRTKTKVSRSVRRRREKLEEETASIIQQLDIFMEALESSECSECRPISAAQQPQPLSDRSPPLQFRPQILSHQFRPQSLSHQNQSLSIRSPSSREVGGGNR
ncbi:hypothetical protein ACP275_10G018200 [Erythranthe tilingii]